VTWLAKLHELAELHASGRSSLSLRIAMGGDCVLETVYGRLCTADCVLQTVCWGLCTADCVLGTVCCCKVPLARHTVFSGPAELASADTRPVGSGKK